MDGHRDEESTGVSQVLKASHPLASPSSPCSKRSRRSVQKRAVSIPIADGDAFPPSDSWAWRKYGQKPIKGSPYPRGYYRCSSCKGCPARKQVERSRLDPTTLVVTYSADHNHPWPLPKNGRHHQNRSPPEAPPTVEEPKPRPPPSQPTVEHEKYPDVTGEEDKPLLMIDEDGDSFRWFSDLASPSPTSAGSDELLLYSSILFGSADAAAGLAPEEREEAATVADGEEDSMFAGLGELPEYSVVLRRDLAPASWMGTAG